MTHSSGIPVSVELNDAFTKAREDSNTNRFFKIQIVNDEMVLVSSQQITDNFENDFNSLAESAVDKEPCYFLFRLDTKNKFGYEWLLIAFVPDDCKTKQKMIYASSLENAKRMLGSGYFAGDFHCSLKSELNMTSFEHWHRSVVDTSDRTVALTEKEKQIQSELSQEVHTGVSTKSVHGVRFPVSDAGVEALKKIKEKTTAFASFKIENEKIELSENNDQLSAEELAGSLPTDEPRFVYFVYRHQFEDKDVDPIVFIYSCPENTKVKQKMVYSSTKANIIDYATAVGIKADRSLEITDLKDLTAEFLFTDIHPAQVEKKTFKKPTRAGKGNARLVKTENN